MASKKYFGRLLIVDDDQEACDFWRMALGEEGFRVEATHNLEGMRDHMSRYTVDAVLLDLQLGEEYGLDGLNFLMTEYPNTAIFILTAHASIESAVSAMGAGATDYISKDTDPQEIARTICQHLAKADVQSTFSPEAFADVGLVGNSLSYQRLCGQIEQMIGVDSTVLILGESGTGKEVVARTIHQLSKRGKKRFEAVNCAAIPENLLESELFGHVKGSFTDARNDRKGIFELCSDGTLLLDEIGDMPLRLQSKLLRVLQEREVVPVGSSRPVSVNTRIIAATHRDLIEEIENGRFREDLYYRLSVVPLQVPPLRHRKEDIPILLARFIHEFSQRFGKIIAQPGPAFTKRLLAYDWPGNIRELRNAVERAVVLSQNGQLSIDHIFQHLTPYDHHDRNGLRTAKDSLQPYFQLPLTEAKQAFERAYMEHLLATTAGNISETSKRSGRYRADIYKMLEKYHLDVHDFRSH